MTERKDPIIIVQERTEFYKHHARYLILATLLSILSLLVSGITCMYLMFYPRKPVYFATNAQGMLTPMIALNQPLMKRDDLLQWAVNATISMFNYNFVDYRQSFERMRPFFDSDGWQSFLSALSNSGNLSLVKDKKLVVSAVVTHQPVVLSEGLTKSGNSYYWKVQLKLLVQYENNTEQFTKEVAVTLSIVRVSTLQSPWGVGIRQCVVEQS